MTIWVPRLTEGKPLYLAIADALAEDVALGTLQPGDKLPPHRDLAWRLKVTVGTVTRAYKEAEIRGLVLGEVGRGSFVRNRNGLTAIQSTERALNTPTNLCHAAPPRMVTTAEFDAAIAHVMREPGRLHLLDYAPPEGEMRDKRLGQLWLKRSGLEVDEQNIVTAAGAHMGVIATLLDLMQPGEAIMSEHLTYPSLRPALQSFGMRIIPLEMDQHGLTPPSFEHHARSGASRLLYLVPTLQNPTTATMPRERREQIVEIAKRYDITLLEDDPFRLLDPRLQPPPFYALAPERTFYITSMSKILAPGLRIGFIATPPGRALLLRENLKVACGRTMGTNAEIARYWLETDIADTIMARVVREVGKRRQLFLDVFKGCSFRCEPGALFAWLRLPERWRVHRFVSALEVQGVIISPGSVFSCRPYEDCPYVRICLGGPERLEELQLCLSLIRRLMDENPPPEFRPVA